MFCICYYLTFLVLVNLALLKQSHQSSVFFGYNANRGNDGNTATSLSAGSCFHTSKEPAPPWWSVDLGTPSTVYKVTIKYVYNFLMKYTPQLFFEFRLQSKE